MKLDRLYPTPHLTIDGDDREQLRELYRPPVAEWVRLNLITSVTGAASGSDGTSETLTNAADRRILGIIRELADVVLIGAESARAEGYVQPKNSRLAIVTSSGNLTGHRIAAGTDRRPLVLCPPNAAEAVRSTLADAEILEIASADDRLTPDAIVASLRSIGLASIVCEGGPRLAAQFVDAGLVDEFCLATSPRIGGAAFPVLGTSTIAERTVELHSLLRDEWSGLYARWFVSV